MKTPLRIIVPILGAVLVAGGLLFVIGWQLQTSSDRLLRAFQGSVIPDTTNPSPLPLTPIDSSDKVLLQLRQGDLAALEGDWIQAEKAYTEAVDAGGGIPALRKLAQAQMQRRDTQGVQNTLKKLEEAGAREEDLLLLRTILLLRQGELVQARTLLDASADSPHKQYGLALLAIIQGENEAAGAHIAAVLGGWDPTLRAYARTLQNAYDEYAQFPKSPAIHLTTLLARALAQTQECELALPMLNQVLTEQDDYRDAWMVRGYCELVSERPEQALSSFQRAYAEDPEKPEIQYFLGRAYAQKKDYKNSIMYLQYAIQNGFQPEGEARRRLAESAIAGGDSRLALDQYTALSTAPDADIGIFTTLVHLQLTLQQKEGAYTSAQTAVQKWPDDAKAYDLLGWTAEETGRKQDAQVALKRALELDPGLESAKKRLEGL